MPEETPPRAQRYAYKALLSYSQGILERLGLGSKDAMEVAACLINADLRGVYSHGVVRLPVYAKRITAGIVNTQPQIRVEERTPNCALVDGDNGPGPVVAALAMTKAIELAQTHGAAFVAVRRSNHFGAAAHYVQKALTCGLIGIASSNAPPNMAPYGGKQKFLGTNPLAIGIP
ncbi:MAG: Ldh family oxidoreductase, partial [Deinococcota bacterium]|nr:Ldh family oxidoreductase [Deinococcota bacterium]